MTSGPIAPQPQPAPALTADQLAIVQLGMFVLAVASPARLDEITSAYDAPAGATLTDAASALRAQLAAGDVRATTIRNTLIAIGA